MVDLGYRLVLLVVLVVCEQVLEALLFQKFDAVLQIVFVDILPLTLSILIFVVDLRGWVEGGSHLVIFQGVPVEVFEPRMHFYFGGAVGAEALDWFPLNKPINEINGISTPASRRLIWINLDLSCKYHIADLLAAPPVVWPPTHHALVCDDAHGVVVHADTVVLLAHNFRSHVAGCSAVFLGVVLLPQLGNSEVRNLEEAV